MLLGPYQRNLKKYNIFNRFSIVYTILSLMAPLRGGRGAGQKYLICILGLLCITVVSKPILVILKAEEVSTLFSLIKRKNRTILLKLTNLSKFCLLNMNFEKFGWQDPGYEDGEYGLNTY